MVFIGPMDLSQSLGRDVMGQRKHPKLLEAIDQIIEKVNKAGKAVGTVADNAQMAKELMEKGVRYIPISSDQGMIGNMAKNIVKEFNQYSK